MSRPRIALIVGNGFSMSFGHYSSLVGEWNSQEPLSWPIPCPSQKHDFLDSLPRLKSLHERHIGDPDFDVFAKTLDSALCESYGLDPFITPLEARHFLTIAFSHYSNGQTAKLGDSKDWSWYRWIKFHSDNVVCAFSLNYDLLLESIFDDLSLQYYSLQVNHHGYGMPLVKPHGSVDFEIHPNLISYRPTYPLTNFVDLNNTPIIRLQPDKLIYPRSQPLCIVPNESNKYSKYQWVEPANQWFSTEVEKCTHCIFIGISYFECDRPELDAILSSIPVEAEIVVANPHPPDEFMEKLEGRPVMVWDSYDGPVDSAGDIFHLKDAKTGNALRKCICRSGLSYRHCCGAKLL